MPAIRLRKALTPGGVQNPQALWLFGPWRPPATALTESPPCVCAALLARLKSYDAALARYTAARTAYLELPPVLRDGGSWPDEVADCEANILLLDRLRQDSSIAIEAGAFASGGHRMRHTK